MFRTLAQAASRPALFSRYSADLLWDDPHVSRRMLDAHLDPTVDLSSRRPELMARSRAWLTDRFGLGPGARVLDLGCGPGLYANPLAQTGADVLGIDLSRRSVAYARQEAERSGSGATFLQGSYLDAFPEGERDLVLMIFCDFCALSPQQRHGLLRSVADVLAPGGRLVLDVMSAEGFAARAESSEWGADLMGGFWSEHPYVGLHRVVTYPQEQVVLDRYVIVEEDRTRTVDNWLSYFTPEQLDVELAAAGLRTESLLGDVSGAAYDSTGAEFAAVVRRV